MCVLVLKATVTLPGGRERETERDGEVGRRERKEGEPGGELGCIFCPLPPKDRWWFQPTTGAICHLILVMVSTEAMWGLGIFCEPAMLGELALWPPSVLQVNPSVTDQRTQSFSNWT